MSVLYCAQVSALPFLPLGWCCAAGLPPGCRSLVLVPSSPCTVQVGLWRTSLAALSPHSATWQTRAMSGCTRRWAAVHWNVRTAVACIRESGTLVFKHLETLMCIYVRIYSETWLSCIEGCSYFRGRFVHIFMWLGQQALSSLERCPYFTVSVIERFNCIP